MVKVQTARPATLKGLKPTMKLKSVNSYYTSTDIYKIEDECWLYIRTRSTARLKSKWVDVTSLSEKHITDVYRMIGSVTIEGSTLESPDIAGAIEFFNSLFLDSKEVYELLGIEWGMHKKILRKPAYTLFDPVW